MSTTGLNPNPPIVPLSQASVSWSSIGSTRRPKESLTAFAITGECRYWRASGSQRKPEDSQWSRQSGHGQWPTWFTRGAGVVLDVRLNSEQNHVLNSDITAPRDVRPAFSFPR